ncbi:glycosyl transferase family 2 [Flavobacteriaceae bacterium CRH]|nr:glycosyl transferase family 2 [Flavobacteriaceae bacterium CRH]
MNLSILIPLLNEEESLKELYTWVIKVMESNNYSYEIIFVDDGSTDDSWNIIEGFSNENSNVKGIRFMKNFGKSQALHAGFAKAKGDVIITMDADLQDSPDEIPGLYEMITAEKFDLVSGWKKKRYDSVVAKNLPSKLFNWAARKTSGVELNDFNCGLKAYKNTVVKNIEVSGEMHRYIPVLAKNAGFNKIGEKVVIHQARKYGETKFGMDRFINGFLDLITIWFLSRFGKRPMHLFGLLGSIMFLIGFLLALYLGIDKLFIHKTSRLITERPHFYLSITSMIIGTQLFLAGFLGEIILRTKSNEARYKVSREVNF